MQLDFNQLKIFLLFDLCPLTSTHKGTAAGPHAGGEELSLDDLPHVSSGTQCKQKDYHQGKQ